MGLLRRLFGPSNSLLLYHDHLSDEDYELFERQWEEVKRYYRFTTLSELVKKHQAGEHGFAAVLIGRPRKSLFLRAIPALIGESVPVTVFVDPECVGVNRLPLEEELGWFREAYPERLTDETFRHYFSLAWNEPATVDKFLRQCRKDMGPLPLDRMDPTRFDVTWGKIQEIPPDLLELGMALTFAPARQAELKSLLDYLERQTKTRPTAFLHPRAPEGADALKRLGASAIVTQQTGAVEPNTSVFNLPCWVFERGAIDPSIKGKDAGSLPT